MDVICVLMLKFTRVFGGSRWSWRQDSCSQSSLGFAAIGALRNICSRTGHNKRHLANVPISRIFPAETRAWPTGSVQRPQGLLSLWPGCGLRAGICTESSNIFFSCFSSSLNCACRSLRISFYLGAYFMKCPISKKPAKPLSNIEMLDQFVKMTPR